MKASENSVKAARLFGLLGMFSLLSYAAAVIFAPLAYSGYDSLSQAVSDLSADTAPSDRKSTRLNSSHDRQSRMPSSA